jgi:hypothetical protein
MASMDYDDDDDTGATTSGTTATTFGLNDNKSRGHAEAAAARATSHLSHDESWMINLGRGNNNEWLLGPRDEDDWFTGLKPTVCPGECSLCFLATLRSIVLGKTLTHSLAFSWPKSKFITNLQAQMPRVPFDHFHCQS